MLTEVASLLRYQTLSTNQIVVIPCEILNIILSFLDSMKDLGRCSLVSRQFYISTTQLPVFKSIFLKQFAHLISPNSENFIELAKQHGQIATNMKKMSYSQRQIIVDPNSFLYEYKLQIQSNKKLFSTCALVSAQLEIELYDLITGERKLHQSLSRACNDLSNIRIYFNETYFVAATLNYNHLIDVLEIENGKFWSHPPFKKNHFFLEGDIYENHLFYSYQFRDSQKTETTIYSLPDKKIVKKLEGDRILPLHNSTYAIVDTTQNKITIWNHKALKMEPPILFSLIEKDKLTHISSFQHYLFFYTKEKRFYIFDAQNKTFKQKQVTLDLAETTHQFQSNWLITYCPGTTSFLIFRNTLSTKNRVKKIKTPYSSTLPPIFIHYPYLMMKQDSQNITFFHLQSKEVVSKIPGTSNCELIEYKDGVLIYATENRRKIKIIRFLP